MSQQSNQTQGQEFLLPSFQDVLRPTFNEDLYKYLPHDFQELFKCAESRHEKDILLLGVLTVLSGCMPNIIGYYDRKWAYPNLYTFIEAPAGSGKGVLNWTRLIGMPVHKELLRRNAEAKLAFEELKKSKSGNGYESIPSANSLVRKEPTFQLLFIPANNSASSIIQTLNENKGGGILFSTEADTLANALSQDWGNFSDVLRAAFHHEPVELQRRQHREHLSVEQPRLSVLLTGTKGQIFRLIPNTENGLFSRFMFYSFPVHPHFREVFERKEGDPAKSFAQVGEKVLEMYHFLEALDEPIRLSYGAQQQKLFTQFYKELTAIAYREAGSNILATIHRLGLINFKIAMILTFYRYFTESSRQKLSHMKIVDSDLFIAQEITLTLLFHANVLVAEMREGSKFIRAQAKQIQLLEALPLVFNWTHAEQIGNEIGLSSSTVQRYLLNGPFERLGKGKYRKIVK